MAPEKPEHWVQGKRVEHLLVKLLEKPWDDHEQAVRDLGRLRLRLRIYPAMRRGQTLIFSHLAISRETTTRGRYRERYDYKLIPCGFLHSDGI